ncbi:TonB-dependent receptor [Brevundimonas subvibrioides]|uniref:TonB-dependent receptor n=1 Tax=Brevundimonas subvibrioides TaxID=74313 RepID=UPI0022B3369F|nr:TonB-dependent receptor [Brevundimonas subvibrioides]
MILRSILFGTVAMGAMATSALAQTPSTSQETVVDEVVVTGFRRSLQAAIDVKRNENSIVDSISAEDIADFPDLNLAESLQRVPGVQIDRDGGEGRSINVRGLSSDFVRVRLNGLEALATTGGRDQGRANRNRGFDFNVFASELFNSITVRKSQEASVNEGSLGATVDLQTARPFDYSGFTFAAGTQATYNDLSENTGPRATALISNRWLDGRLGALVSAAYSKRETFEDGSSSVGFRVPADDGCVPTSVAGVITSYVNSTRCYQSVGTITTADGRTLTGLAAQAAAHLAAHPRIPRYGRITYDRERLGVTGSIQFDVSDRTRLTFDSLYAKLDQTRNEEFLEIISPAREAGVQGFRAMDLVRGVIDDNATLISATFDDVDARSEQRIDILSTKFTQNALTLTHDFTDTFRFRGLVGSSEAIGTNPQQTTVSFDRYDVDGYSYDYSGDVNVPSINYGFDVTNPANWSLSSSAALGDASIIRLRPNRTENTYDTLEAEFTWDFNDSLTLRAGGSQKEFGFSVVEDRKAVEAVPATAIALLAARGITIDQYSTRVTGLSRGSLTLPGSTPSSFVIPDIARLDALIGFSCNCVNEFGDFRVTPFAGETRAVSETSKGIFLQADFQTSLMDMPVRGNLGVRYVETEVNATGLLGTRELNLTNTYKDTLPALNVSIEPISDLIVRFAAAKVMARPALNQLTPGGTVAQGVADVTLTVGNPFLDPIRATNYDLSVEWYPYDEALFSFALFHKSIDSFVQTTRERLPFSETGFPNDILPAGVLPSSDVIFTSSRNTPGGDLDGFEITLQTPFNFLPERFRGFGGLFNYTQVESEIEYIVSATLGTTTRQPIVGQSPSSWSGTLYYEKGPFEARVSATYRDEYLIRVPGANSNDVEGKAESTNIDMSMSYDIGDSLTLSFEGINLTDQYDERWINSQRKNNLNYEHTGREFVFGVRYRY